MPQWARLLLNMIRLMNVSGSIREKFYFEPQRRKEFLNAVYRDGAVSDYEVTLKCKDGSPLHVYNSHCIIMIQDFYLA